MSLLWSDKLSETHLARSIVMPSISVSVRPRANEYWMLDMPPKSAAVTL